VFSVAKTIYFRQAIFELAAQEFRVVFKVQERKVQEIQLRETDWSTISSAFVGISDPTDCEDGRKTSCQLNLQIQFKTQTSYVVVRSLEK
jgi:hypothetical protein